MRAYSRMFVLLAAVALGAYAAGRILQIVDPQRSSAVLSVVVILILFGSVTLVAPFFISLGAQGLNPAFPFLGPNAARAGAYGLAAFVGLTAALFLQGPGYLVVAALVCAVLLGLTTLVR